MKKVVSIMSKLNNGKKSILLNKIKTENIDPYLPRNQIIDVTKFNTIVITFYYHYERDCLLIRVEIDNNLVFEEMGARPMYNEIIKKVRLLKDVYGRK